MNTKLLNLIACSALSLIGLNSPSIAKPYPCMPLNVQSEGNLHYSVTYTSCTTNSETTASPGEFSGVTDVDDALANGIIAIMHRTDENLTPNATVDPKGHNSFDCKVDFWSGKASCSRTSGITPNNINKKSQKNSIKMKDSLHNPINKKDVQNHKKIP